MVQQALVSEKSKNWPSFHADVQFRGTGTLEKELKVGKEWMG